MKRILKYACFFNLYQRLIGCRKYLKNYANNFVLAQSRQSILEIGCATGNIIEFFPKNIDYTGIDYSQSYINFAKNKYPEYTFICQNAAEEFILNKKFDVVICEAVLASISDSGSKKLLYNIKNHIHKNSRIIISDMNYSVSNTKLQNFFLRHERGNNLRNKDDYIKLISEFFKIDKITVLNDVYRIPYSKIIFECSSKI